MRKSAIRIFAGALVLLSCFFLQGCNYQVQLSQRMLIQGMGIDYENGLYRATMQVTLMNSDDENQVSVLQGEGQSAMDALNSVTLSSGRKPLYSHSLILVLGRACAERGLSDMIDFFIRYPESHPTVNVLLADGEAEEILTTKQQDETYVKARDIADIAKGGKYNGETVQAEMLDVINQLRGEGSSPYLPMVKREGGSVIATGTAVFSGDRLVTELSKEETRGLLLITGKLRSGTQVVEIPEIGKASMELESATTKITPLVDGKNVRFSIEIECGASIGAADMQSGKILDNAMYQTFGRKLEEELQQSCIQVIDTCVRKNHSDIFNFGRRLYQTHPEYWKQHADSWKEEMTQADYAVKVTVQLRRGGQEITGLEDKQKGT